MDEKVMTIAMEIIMHAGDGRLRVSEALNAVSKNDYVGAAEKLKEAQKEITQAHRLQTDMIQDEAKGEGPGYSLLFTHAQDTLMTINSEFTLAKQLVKVFESFEERFSKIEKGE
jgi:PTS system cellobiose-specific IIA component